MSREPSKTCCFCTTSWFFEISVQVVLIEIIYIKARQAGSVMTYDGQVG